MKARRESKEKGLNVFMTTCPQSHPPTAPHPAIAYLRGYIEQELPGTQTTGKDLNAIFYSYVFSREQLGKAFPEDRVEEIAQAYGAQRDEATYRDISRFIENHRTLEQA